MVVDGVSFQVQIHPQVFADCNDVAAKLNGKEIAVAHIFYKFGATPDPSNRMLRVLSAQVDTDKSYVEMPDIGWPNMSPAEVGDTHAALSALYENLNERQLAYDKLTAHGVHQSLAPEGLRGDDVHLTCRAKRTP